MLLEGFFVVFGVCIYCCGVEGGFYSVFMMEI